MADARGGRSTNRSGGARADAREARRDHRHATRASATYVHFVNRVAEQLGLEPERAQHVALAVVNVLELRLNRDEAEDLEAQLPFIFRELLAQADVKQGERMGPFGRDRLLQLICEQLSVGPAVAERYARGVFRALRSQVSPGEIAQVVHILPADLRELWDDESAR